MKKALNKLKYIICFILLVPCLLLFSGCDNSGLSAYDIAVKNGFKGTEQEWLASLQGDDGKDGKDGKNGENGANGANGTNGKDAENLNLYDLYVTAKNNNEFDGDFMDFLAEFVTDSSIAQAVANENLLSVYTIYSYENLTSTSPDKKGSAVLYSYTDTGAFVVTNAHVTNSSSTENYEHFTLGIYGQNSTKRIPATFVGSSKTYDLAVVYVADKTPLVNAGAKPVTIAEKPAVAGTGVIAIGNTKGAGIAVSKGIVSVESENWDISLFSGEDTLSYRVLRHDAFIASGNSGGGLFDYSGNLVGITNGGSTEAESINFALPASSVKNVVENIIFNCYEKENKKIIKCVLGIEISIIDTTTTLIDGIAKVVDTLKITDIVDGKAVSKASTITPENALEIGDVLKSIIINQKEYVLNRNHDLDEALLIPKENDTIVLNFVKDGETEITSLNITFSAEDFAEIV